MKHASWKHFAAAGFVATLIFTLAAGCAPGSPEAEHPPAGAADAEARIFDTIHYRIRLGTVADGLSHPYTLTFLPGGGMLVTEMDGRVRLIRDGALRPEPVGVIPDVHYVPEEGRGGLMDVALHPNFAENHWVYFTYNKPGEHGVTIALARGAFDGTQLTGLTDIFVADAWATVDNHSSRIAFAPDGMLYMAVSQRVQPERAQNLNDHMGKLLRLRDDGTAPADNPFVGRARHRAEIFTYGHRNFHGAAIHPETGEVWTHEHGDEINIHKPGANHGWPYVGVGGQGGGVPIGNPPVGLELTEPYIALNPSIGIHGMTFYTGARFPEWQGDLFVGGSRTQGISRFKVGEDGPGVREDLFTQFQRIRDVRQGPDGLIYFITDGAPGAVMRIEPAE